MSILTLKQQQFSMRARGLAARMMGLAASLWLLVMICALSAHAATYTVTNTNDSGAGSLRSAIASANSNAGADTIAFNIPAGQLTSGVAVITLTSGPLVITGASTTIDGTTQTSNVGNTNAGTLGAGGTVGVDNLFLATVNRPEVQIVNGTSPAVTIGLDVQASSVTIRGLAIYGFGRVANSDNNATIRIGNNFTGTLIEQNIIGASATSFTDPGASRSVGDNIRSAGADSGTVRNNLIGFSAGKGIQLGGGSTGWLVEGNEVRGNGIGNSNLDGIDIENSGGNTVRSNLFASNEAAGVDMYQSSGTNTVQNNTVTGNGIGPNANVETPGVRVYGTGSTIDRNIINANFGAGVMVTSGSSQNTITRNSIYANGTITNKAGAGPSGEIGIDLTGSGDNQTTGSSPFVTLNDSGDGDTGGNGLLNFPVLASAAISGSNLVLTGFARPGSAIEFFIAAADPSGFGEGQTYLTTLTEGSAADTDASSGTYTSPVNGLNVGTDTTNRFRFTIPVPPGLSIGARLTSTATLGGNTSEFSGNVAVQFPPSIALNKSVSPNTGQVLPGTDLVYSIAFSNTGGASAANFIITDPIPANTDFKVGSVTTTLGTTGLTVTVSYSNDGAVTWTYTPASGAGGAPSGYDRIVTHVRWSFGGNLSQTAPNNAGSAGFTVRVR